MESCLGDESQLRREIVDRNVSFLYIEGEKIHKEKSCLTELEARMS